MIAPVTESRWLEAQAAELTTAIYNETNCQRSYAHIFDYLGITFDQRDKQIIEVGCGAYPAVGFCQTKGALVFEPLPFESLKQMEDEGRFVWTPTPFEKWQARVKVDEVWLFNALQHVQDPELVVAKAKATAHQVRYFEPVDYGTCVYHPHTFSEADFERWFPNSVKRYTDRLDYFFDADCCYGSFEC